MRKNRTWYTQGVWGVWRTGDAEAARRIEAAVRCSGAGAWSASLTSGCFPWRAADGVGAAADAVGARSDNVDVFVPLLKKLLWSADEEDESDDGVRSAACRSSKREGARAED